MHTGGAERVATLVEARRFQRHAGAVAEERSASRGVARLARSDAAELVLEVGELAARISAEAPR